ncbi:hypothetical protein Hanom_Chr16g01481121 [Helianthus anomalus]
MSRTGRSMIRSVLSVKDLESFVETYRIPEHFSPTLPGLDDSAECTPDRIVLYTLSFSSYGVRYPLSSFKVDLLRHFKVHFPQLHPLGFMRVVHSELSCVVVSSEPSITLFCMFYKLISDGDWFTFAKWKDSISQPCYSFILTSTYPKEWKSLFIFVSAAMIPESSPLRDAKAAIEDNVPILSADEIVQWKRMYENPTRAFTFPDGLLAMGGLSPSYPVRPKAFVGKKCISLEASSGEKRVPPGSLQVRSSSDDDDDEDLQSRLARKRKTTPSSSPKPVLVPRDIRLRLRSPSGRKAFPTTRVASELPPTGVKGSMTKHLRLSCLMSEPLLRSSHAPIEIPTAPSSSRIRDKTLEVSVARVTPAF